jgi:hypothetical protein
MSVLDFRAGIDFAAGEGERFDREATKRDAALGNTGAA